MRIPEGPGLKIPHMGWNSLNVREGASLFKDWKRNLMCILCIRIICRPKTQKS